MELANTQEETTNHYTFKVIVNAKGHSYHETDLAFADFIVQVNILFT